MKKMYLFIGIVFLLTGNLVAQRVSPFTKLVWADEFEGEGLPDPEKWGYEVGYTRNGELQYYTYAREENAFQKDGCLHIVVRKDDPILDKNGNIMNHKQHNITSANLVSTVLLRYYKDSEEQVADPSGSAWWHEGKKDLEGYWKYGRIEVRAKVPGFNKGSWPAIWMMPIGSGDWPACGEIDIMEHVGYSPDEVHFTVHTAKYNDRSAAGMWHQSYPYENIDDDFHVFALEWTETSLEWYLDDQRLPVHSFYNESPGVYNREVWPFNEPFYLMLNMAYGGGWGGREGVDVDQLPLTYLVDYVRVYERETSSVKTVDGTHVSVYPNPVTDKVYIEGMATLKEVSVFNIGGQQIATYKNVSGSVDLGHLNPGYYLMQLKDDKGNAVIEKILKQ